MWELVLIFMVFLLVFGAKRLPEIGQSLGKGIREFKGSLREIEGEFKTPDDSARRANPPAERTASSESEPRKLSQSAPPSPGDITEASQREKEEVPNGNDT
ncbi:MAG: twin-arginine translocase TatA/TatE family subunit [Gemmatimonadota bacterium]